MHIDMDNTVNNAKNFEKPMKFIIAPDSFKGSLSASEATNAIARGTRSVYPNAEIALVPLADGGEGTVDALVAATGGRYVRCRVKGPLGGTVEAAFGISGLNPRTAFIEMAAASGITLIEQSDRDPLRASTYGTGQLLLAAIEAGAKEIVIGIGGSATNDGGAGAMQALGVQFLDAGDRPIESPVCGADLINLSRIDVSGMRFPVGDVSVTIASDVTNPLIGPNGASAVYGPQKGANSEMVKQLDEALTHYANIIAETLSISIADLPGAGAAGGLGGGLIAFLKANMASGIDIILDAANFDIAVKDADWVITGEGRIDSQTLQGKTISGVMKRTRSHSKARVIAFGGAVDESARQSLIDQGLHAAVAVSPEGMSVKEAMANASTLLERSVAETISSLL